MFRGIHARNWRNGPDYRWIAVCATGLVLLLILPRELWWITMIWFLGCAVTLIIIEIRKIT